MRAFEDTAARNTRKWREAMADGAFCAGLSRSHADDCRAASARNNTLSAADSAGLAAFYADKAARYYAEARAIAGVTI